MELTESLPPRCHPQADAVARRSRDGRSLRDFGGKLKFIVTHSPSPDFVGSSLPEGAFDECNLRGKGFALCLCNIKAKLAIKQEATNETCFTRRAVD